jgi:hypothetical protein
MRVFVLLSFLLVAGCQTIAAPEREGVALPTPSTPLSQTGPFLGDRPTDVDALVRQFDGTVFRTDGGGAYPFVHKWVGPVRYSADGRVLPHVETAGESLAAIAGLDIRQALTRAEVNLTVSVGS